ncbi:MAG: hypothetical protein K1X54_11745 [Flavobacteriales bacterium]|nr:hypothetical protein [Flavobacteriales bacterium]
MSKEIIIDELVKHQVEVFLQDSRYENIAKEYALPTKVVDGGILFIGLNPSEDKSDKNERMFRYELKQEENKHQYFNKFESIAKTVGMHWDHLDVLLVRKTKQSGIHEMLLMDHGRDFIWDQLQIFKTIFDKTSPKVIVVSNTLAATLLGLHHEKATWLGYSFNWNDELGTYFYGDIPVFFTSMLSGQRALDLGSLKRLEWHIKYVLKEIKTSKNESTGS